MKLIMDGEGNVYRSIAEAEAATGTPHQNISAVIAGKRASAGGTTWTRVTDSSGSALTFEDLINKAIEDIRAKIEAATPRQKQAAAKARQVKAKYREAVSKARSVGLLFYHTPKSMGKNPSNKKLHDWNMEKNPDYKAYYEQATAGSGDIREFDTDRLDW